MRIRRRNPNGTAISEFEYEPPSKVPSESDVPSDVVVISEDIARVVKFELPADKEVASYRLGRGEEIVVYRAVKQQGKPSRLCCAYCHRAFHTPARKPLTKSRIKELERRKQRAAQTGGETLKKTIAKMRRNDELRNVTPKSDQDYLKEIMTKLLAAS